MREVRYFDKLVSDLRSQPADFLVWTLQKLVEKPQLAHDLECRGVDRIPAEIPQEIGMLFENENGDPGSGEQKPEHHTGGAPAGDAAANRNLAIHHDIPAHLTPLLRMTCHIGGGDGKWTIWADFSFSSRAVSFAVT
jgi:hypothetical protein